MIRLLDRLITWIRFQILYAQIFITSGRLALVQLEVNTLKREKAERTSAQVEAAAAKRLASTKTEDFKFSA